MEVLGRRCESLMRASEKEVEQLERKAREEAGLPVDAAEGEELPPIQLPSFKEMQRMLRSRKQQEKEVKKQELEQKLSGFDRPSRNSSIHVDDSKVLNQLLVIQPII